MIRKRALVPGHFVFLYSARSLLCRETSGRLKTADLLDETG